MRRPLAALKCSRRERNLQHRRTNQPTNEPPFAPSLPCFMIYSLSLSRPRSAIPPPRNWLKWPRVGVSPSVRPMYNYTTSDYPTTLSSSFSMQTHARPDRTLAPTIVLSSFYSHFLFYAFRLRLPIVQHVTITIFMFRTFRLQFPLILDSLSDDLLTYSDSKRGCQIANLREFVLWPFDSQNAAFKAVNGELFSQTDWRL